MNHRSAVAEDVVAAEQHLIAAFVETAVTGLVAWRVQHLEIAVAERKSDHCRRTESLHRRDSPYESDGCRAWRRSVLRSASAPLQ